jgi:hypothetical protein
MRVDITKYSQRVAQRYNVQTRRHAASHTASKPLGVAGVLFLRHYMSSDLTVT